MGLDNEFSVFNLAQTRPEHLFRAILTVDLQYVLRKDGTSELVEETEFKRAKEGFPEYPTREESFNLLWYPSPNDSDKLNLLGEECLGKRMTQCPDSIDDAIDSIKNGTEVLHDKGFFVEDMKSAPEFHKLLCQKLGARVSILEDAGHRILVDFSSRIYFDKGIVKVYGRPSQLIQAYHTGEGYAKFPVIRNVKTATRILQKKD
jgi:hypothetical protein